MTATPAVTDRTGASDQEFADRVAAFEGVPAAPESFDPIAVIRRVEALADRYDVTAERRRGLAVKFAARDRETAAEDFLSLADESQLAATRIRAALSGEPR